MDNFSKLPEGCISQILSMTSPADACRSSAISTLFNAAAGSDSMWESFLPSDYRQIVSRLVSPVVFSTKKQLYFSLCECPLLLDGGKLGFALDRVSGKKCYTLPARNLTLLGKRIPDTGFSEVAQLLNVWWLDIWGTINIAMLSANTTYAAYLIFKIINQRHFGFESIPVKASVRFLKEGEEYEDDKSSTVSLTMQPLRSRHRGEREIGQLPRENVRFPHIRKDGWMEIELGEFHNDKGDDGEVEMRLREVDVREWKAGLIVEGIEVRPKVGG